jgi:hypothetical protein
MPDSEKEKFGIRIGWSNLSSGLHALQLGKKEFLNKFFCHKKIYSGEFNDSFAYTNSGKKMSKFTDEVSEDTYGDSFGLSDILGCYIDFGDNNDENIIRISFTKNGQDYGQAFEIDKKTNADENRFIFYPHILVKNIKFECNFGQLVRELISFKTKLILFFFFRKILGQK